jgi:hypothetical protein
MFILAALLSIAFTGCDLFTGPAGEDGVNGGNIPGGFIQVQASTLIPASEVLIIFDPDNAILSGNESTVVIPVGDYQVAGGLDWRFSWRAPNVNPGNYFIYFWIDINGNGIIDSVNEESSFVLYDPDNYYFLEGSPPGSIGFEIPLEIPNYTFWSDFAPQLDLIVLETSAF